MPDEMPNREIVFVYVPSTARHAGKLIERLRVDGIAISRLLMIEEDDPNALDLSNAITVFVAPTSGSDIVLKPELMNRLLASALLVVALVTSEGEIKLFNTPAVSTDDSIGYDAFRELLKAAPTAESVPKIDLFRQFHDPVCAEFDGSVDFEALETVVGASSSTPHKPGYATRTIYFATDRRQCLRPRLGARFYDNERAPGSRVSYGKCIVSIPSTHRIGLIESPLIWKFQFRTDPKKHVMVLKCETQDRTAFFADVKTTVERSIGREAFVFVHGYNVSFEDAARRTAQIAYDLKFAGAAILFSWPSKAKFKTYVADETNVRWTVPQLRTFLEDLATQAGADTIHLIAHSMGNRALTDVLEQLAIAGTVKMPAFRQIVLAAPDIDADVFRKLVTVIKATGERMTLYSCAKDKALEASRRFHGYPRAGDSIIIVRGVDTIDASAVDTSLLGHSYFGNNRTVLTDIFALLNDGDPPEDRFGMTPRQLTGGTYYAFAP